MGRYSSMLSLMSGVLRQAARTHDEYDERLRMVLTAAVLVVLL